MFMFSVHLVFSCSISYPIYITFTQVDQENSEHCYDNNKISHNDSDSDCESCFEDPAVEVKLG